jgi:hypothetical protein
MVEARLGTFQPHLCDRDNDRVMIAPFGVFISELREADLSISRDSLGLPVPHIRNPTPQRMSGIKRPIRMDKN